MSENPITNEEFDALMEAVQAGEVGKNSPPPAKREVKTYDFARPDKFSKEQIRTLEMIHSSCARSLTTQLSTLLRSSVEVELKTIQETSYLEFFESIQNPAAIALMSLEPLVGRGLLKVDTEMAFVFIDRLLGGPGKAPAMVRELTEIEKGLMERVVGRVQKSIADAWSTLVPLKPQLEMIIGSTLFSQIALPDDRLVLVDFSFRLGVTTGIVSFGVPITALDPILSKLNAQQWFSGGRQTSNEGFMQMISQSLDGTGLEVKVVLGSTEVSIGDLLDLQVGDLVCLDRRAGAEMDIIIGEHTKFRGQAGQVGRRLGVQITQVVQGEE